MADLPVGVEEESRLQRIYQDSKQRRAVPTSGYLGDAQVLERVRSYEQVNLNVQHNTGLVSARGDDIERLALLDGLTELYNFRTFVKELKAELNRSKRYKTPLSLLMICIDDFDSVAARYGQLTQDAVQKVIANVLRRAIREVDVPAKYSDQHFAAILPNTNAAGASLVAERIRQRIGNQAIAHNWQSFSVTASVGVATFPMHASEYDELTARAIEALEFAAARGGDRVFSI